MEKISHVSQKIQKWEKTKIYPPRKPASNWMFYVSSSRLTYLLSTVVLFNLTVIAGKFKGEGYDWLNCYKIISNMKRTERTS